MQVVWNKVHTLEDAPLASVDNPVADEPLDGAKLAKPQAYFERQFHLHIAQCVRARVHFVCDLEVTGLHEGQSELNFAKFTVVRMNGEINSALLHRPRAEPRAPINVPITLGHKTLLSVGVDNPESNDSPPIFLDVVIRLNADQQIKFRYQLPTALQLRNRL